MADDTAPASRTPANLLAKTLLPKTLLPSGMMRALGTPSHPLSDLKRLALRIGAGDKAVNLPEITGFPGPQMIEDLGQRLGVTFLLVTRDIGALTSIDCPCVVLLSDGTSRLVLEAHDNGALVLAGEGNTTARADRRMLAASATGGAFIARREEREATPLPAGAPLGAAAGTTTASNPVASFLLKTAFERRQLIIALAVAGLLSGLINLAVPIFTMVVFDRVIPHAAFETLWALLIGVGLLLAVDFALRHVRHALHDAVSVAAMTRMGGRFFSRLIQTPLSKAPAQAGPLLQPFNEMNAAAQVAPQFMAGLMVDVPFFLIVVGLMAMLGGWVAVVPMVGVLLLALTYWIGHKLSARNLSEEHRLSQRQTQAMIDAVNAGEMIRVTGAGPQMVRAWEERADAAALAGHAFRSQQNMANHAGAVILQLVTICTVAGGAYLVSASLMTVGALSACMMLASRAVMPIATLLAQGFRLQQLITTTAGVGSILNAPAEQGQDDSQAGRGVAVSGAYTLSNVSFTHAEAAAKALDAINMRITPGERIAIIGKSGSGKSTLLRLLALLHPINEGSLHIDGRDSRQLDPQALRRAVALMPQDPYLFDASLEANMSVGLSTPEPEWFRLVANLTGVASFADKHPSGYSLTTGSGGQRLSGGERQSVALARALMGQPKLLLLDEPTAAMDNEREARIIQALSAELNTGALQSTGLIVATHRMPILALVDRIIWMDGGRIIADGPKADLMAKLSAKAA
jgi:ATP-binding cassette, subfamily C, bacterial LapB